MRSRRRRKRSRRGGTFAQNKVVHFDSKRQPGFVQAVRKEGKTGTQLRMEDQRRRLQKITDQENRKSWAGFLTTPKLWFSDRGKTGGRKTRRRRMRRRRRTRRRRRRRTRRRKRSRSRRRRKRRR